MMSNETNSTLIFDERLTGDPRRSGGGGMPPNIEERVANLEKGMAVVDTKLDNITENYATKADLKALETEIHKMSTSITRWYVVTTVSIVALVFGIASYFSG